MNYTLLAALCQIYDSPASSCVFCGWQDCIHTWAWKKKKLITTFYKLPNHDLRLSTGTDKKKIQMKAFRNNTTRHFQINTSPLILLFPPPSMLNSAWWPTPLEQTWKRTGYVLNTLNSVNNAEADCKSLYAPGVGWRGVNKGGLFCVVFSLYSFMFS